MNKKHDALIFIAMIYIAVDLSSMVFAYKFINIGPVFGMASSLIFPLTYSIMDVVAEVYGYQEAKKIIWYGFACDFIFALLVLSVSRIPSVNLVQTTAYRQIFNPLFKVVIAQMLGVLSGAFINIYLISKWKIMTSGKYFWLRSIGSSTVGEAIMLIISACVALVGAIPFSILCMLIIYAYLYKILFAIMVSPFVSITATLLKYKLDDSCIEPTSFNPFDISCNQDILPSFPKL